MRGCGDHSPETVLDSDWSAAAPRQKVNARFQLFKTKITNRGLNLNLDILNSYFMYNLIEISIIIMLDSDWSVTEPRRVSAGSILIGRTISHDCKILIGQKVHGFT